MARAPARRAPKRDAPPAPSSGAAEVLFDGEVWLLLPLRAFLGVTFLYAGLQKLADRWFFSGAAPSSVQSQLHAALRTSPVGGLLATPAHHAVLFGLLIAFGEVAIGVGTLLGLWARAAAVGGMVLSLSFLLAVSWHSRPYYYGADVVFLFAWTPLAIAGAGRFSVDALAATRARADLGLRPPVPVTLEFATVQRLCGYYDAGRCSALHARRCGPSGCPVLKASGPPPRTAAELDRRTLLTRAGWAGWAAAGTVLAGGFVALAGRVVPPRPKRVATASLSTGAPSGTDAPTPGAGPSTATTPASGAPPASTASSEAPATAPPATAPPPTAPPATAPPTTKAIAGTRIGPASAVPVGGAASFTDPRTGDPAYALQPVRGRFVAFDATCTHNGCPVQYAGSEFQCPCHGAAFDTSTGAVVQGPARRPLRAIPIQAGPDGQLYVQ
ncbi:MAG TPA: Rieske 2Fe-2S domain-containing protein [Acidimicrobiales bacterium]|nr:Rieske 2Fe-2S domain-containing protein [Acidimicrobiales bacterium]